MNASIPVSAVDDNRALNLRWAQWQADGAVADRRMRQRMLVFAAAIACGFGAWLAVILRAT